jgi:stress response protein YsnF
VNEPEDTAMPNGGENLDVSKNIAIGQTTITKEPITETKTVNVQVTHEGISIETRPK